MVLLLPERAVLLNETAAEILELCQDRTVEEIVEALRVRYEAGPDLEEDVLGFL
jgi:coenzyme PQQ biosynthesis protein PqqD